MNDTYTAVMDQLIEAVENSDARTWELMANASTIVSLLIRERDEARAENERLRGELMAMVRTIIRGNAHDDGDYTATFTMHELHRARSALNRKPE